MAAPVIIQLQTGEKVDRFTATKKLGEGTFGAVYAVKDEQGNEHALKAEMVGEKIPLLKLELYVMQKLTARRAKHMATLIDKGRFSNFNYIVMKFLGKSLQDAKKTGPNGHLTLGCAIGASIQCLEALEELHWCGFLHRDVKPGNFTVGRAEFNELRKVYVLDFGLCRRFVDDNNVMIQARKKAPYRGTPRYAPIASHEGNEHGRKDDVESWFYMLVDFTNASLPWKVVSDLKEVGDMKKNARNEPMIQQLLSGCPFAEYKLIMSHIDGLTFFSEPNYGLIYSTLRGVMKKQNLKEFPMEVVKKRVTMLTNCEVLEFLKNMKKDDEKKSEKLKMLNTVVWETRKYLQASPAATQNSDMINEILPKLKPFKLTTAETLQIINLRPAAPADIQLLVEETEERFPDEEELSNLVEAVTTTLPPPPPRR